MLRSEDGVILQQSAFTDPATGECAVVNNAACSVSVLSDIRTGVSQIETVVNELRRKSWSAVNELLINHCTDKTLRETIEQETLNYQQQLSKLTETVVKLKKDLGGVFNQLHLATDSKPSSKRKINYVRSELESQQYDHKCVSQITANVADSSNDSSDYDSGVQVVERATCKSDISTGESTVVSKSLFECLLDDSNSDTVCEVGDDLDVNNRDQSLTVAANRSLDMSRSLTEKCAQLADLQLVDERSSLSPLVSAFYNPPSPNNQSVISMDGTRKNGEKSHDIRACIVLRRQISLEILDTERKYCSCLRLLINHFSASLSQSDIVPAVDIEVIFPPCLARIHEFHRSFLLQLENRLAVDQQEILIGDLLDSFVSSLDCDLLGQYKLYVCRLPDALVKLRLLSKQNMGFNQIVTGLQLHRSCEGLDVSAFLLTPVQRIPRYVLLLKQLMKNTDTTHCDYFYLERSMSRLGDLLSRLNGSIEQSMTAVNVAHSASSPSPKPKRRFQLHTFSFRSGSCDTPCDRRNSESRFHRKDGNSALPVVGWPRSRRYLPSSTSTPVASRMFPVHSDPGDPADFNLCQPKDLGAAPIVASEKENSFKWPSLSSVKNAFQHSTKSGLKSFPSTVDCSGSLFDISNIGWDQEASCHATQSSNCNDILSSEKTQDEIHGSTLNMAPRLVSSVSPSRHSHSTTDVTSASVISDIQMVQPVIRTASSLRDSGPVNIKRKLSSDSAMGNNGFSILKKLTRRKSLKLSNCEESETNKSVMTLRRKPSFRDSLKGIFARRRSRSQQQNVSIVCMSQTVSMVPSESTT